MCWFWETSCLAKEAAQTVGDSLMDQLAHNVSVAMASTIETLGSFWVTVPTIPLGDTQGRILAGTHLVDLVHTHGL